MAAAVDDFVRAWQREGDACWALADGAFVAGKELFASLIGADAGGIATVENTSVGLSIAFAGCPGAPWSRPRCAQMIVLGKRKASWDERPPRRSASATCTIPRRYPQFVRDPLSDRAPMGNHRLHRLYPIATCREPICTEEPMSGLRLFR